MKTKGFTLIELSIVLVIIGLIIGGILAGKDMLRAAELRRILSEKDGYISAVNQFKNKYNAVPGDMLPAQATKSGLTTFTGAFAGYPAMGDGNGLIEGDGVEYSCIFECGIFWQQLRDAGIIKNTFSAVTTDTSSGCPGIPVGEDPSLCVDLTLSKYMPKAPIAATYWGALNVGYSYHFMTIPTLDQNRNVLYLAIRGTASQAYAFSNAPSISAIDMYSLDIKVDDGRPNAGKILASTTDLTQTFAYWSATVNANSNVCTTGGGSAVGATTVYNANKSTGGDKLTCIPIFIW